MDFTLNDIQSEFVHNGFFDVTNYYCGVEPKRRPGTYLIFIEIDQENGLWQLLYVGSSKDLRHRASRSHPCYSIPKRLMPENALMIKARYTNTHLGARLEEKALISIYHPILNVVHKREVVNG